MNISNRLKKIIDLTSKTDTIADIGTDHGYVPIEIIKQGKAISAIATDVNEGPLNKAMINAEFEGIENISFRLGDGLTVFKKGDITAAIIAGMGGILIKEIMQHSIDIVKSLDYLILQPAQNPEILREYLYNGKYAIIKEDLVKETDGRFYEYFKVKYSNDIYGFSTKKFDFEMSPVLINDRNPLLREYITSRIAELKSIKSKLNLDFAAARIKDREINSSIEKYEEILKWQ